MRLLKIALLSTTLLMSGVFASDAVALDSAAGTTSSAVQAVDTYRAYMEYKGQMRETCLGLLTEEVPGVDLAGLGITEASDDADALVAMQTVLADLVKQLKEAQQTIERLTREKDEALTAATAQLDTVTAEKNEASRQLVAAEAKVVHLDAALKAAQKSATQEGESATTKIEKLTTDLTAATKERKDLAGKVTALEAEKAAAEQKLREGRTALATLNAAAANQGIRAAIASGESATVGSEGIFTLKKLDGSDDGEDDFYTAPLGFLDDSGSPFSGMGSPVVAVAHSPETTKGEHNSAARNINNELAEAVGDHDVHTGAGDTVASAAVDAEKAEKINKLQAELASAKAILFLPNSTGSGLEVTSPSTDKMIQTHSTKNQRIDAKADVARLTDELKKLGVNPEATAS